MKEGFWVLGFRFWFEPEPSTQNPEPRTLSPSSFILCIISRGVVAGVVRAVHPGWVEDSSPDDVVGELDEAARLELAGRYEISVAAAEPSLVLPVPEHGRDRRREVEGVSGRD